MRLLLFTFLLYTLPSWSNAPTEEEVWSTKSNSELLSEFILVTARLTAAEDFDNEQTVNCTRYFSLINNLRDKIISFYAGLLSRPTDALTEATLQKALLLEVSVQSLLSLTLAKAEGGISIAGNNLYCVDRARLEWTSTLINGAKSLQALQHSFFGNRGDELSRREYIAIQQSRPDIDERKERIAVTIFEVFIAVNGWTKLVRPAMTGVLELTSDGPQRFLVKAAFGSAYGYGLFEGDRYLRQHLGFMQPIGVLPRPSLPHWQDIIHFNEKALISTILAPPFYFGYLQLQRLAERSENVNYPILNDLPGSVAGGNENISQLIEAAKLNEVSSEKDNGSKKELP